MLSNPVSKIQPYPKDMECSILLNIFFEAPFTYNGSDIVGFDHIALKDTIKWRGLKPKKYVAIINKLFKSFDKGIRNRG